MALYQQDLLATTPASRHAYVYRLDNIQLPNSGFYAVTVLGGSNHTYEIAAISWLNKLVGPPEAQNTSSGTSTAVLTGSVTGSAGDLYVAAFSDDSALNPETITFNSGAVYTEEYRDVNAASRFGTAYADAVIGAGGASTASWTLGDSVGWGTASGCYKNNGSTITKDQATTLTQVGVGDRATATFTTNPLPGSSILVYIVTGNIGAIQVWDNTGSAFRAIPAYQLIKPGRYLNSPTYTKMVRTGATIKWFPRPPFSFGSSIHQFTQDLPAVLSFTGPTDLLKAIFSKQNSTLSFTGALIKRTSTGLVVAALGFTGAISKLTRFHQTGTLSFTGSSPSIRTSKGLTGGLSFLGALPRQIASGLIATLGFTGSLIKLDRTTFSGALSFTGVYALRTAHGMTAALSFSGAMLKRAAYALSGALSFAGTIAKQGLKALSGALSFTGVFSVKLIFTKALTATLSFSGTTTRKILKPLAAQLSFLGTVIGFTAPRFLTLVASMTASGAMSKIHWYSGVFKVVSQSVFRAVSRAYNQMLTKDRDLE